MRTLLAWSVAGLFVLPLVFMLATSLRTPAEAAAGVLLAPPSLHLANYADAWRSTNFARQFLNSLLVALLVTLGQIVTSLLAGYAFAHMEFRGRNAIFLVLLSTMIVPFQVLVIPVFVVLAKVGWINSYWALVVPSLANAFGIFLLALVVGFFVLLFVLGKWTAEERGRVKHEGDGVVRAQDASEHVVDGIEAARQRAQAGGTEGDPVLHPLEK